MLKSTPFHSRTAPLVRAQTWRRWAGHQVASADDPSQEREYAAILNAAALFDVSPLHKYLISGRDALRMLDRMVTRDVTKCDVGQVLYSTYMFPFEIASLLLLVAIIGAVVMAKKRI